MSDNSKDTTQEQQQPPQAEETTQDAVHDTQQEEGSTEAVAEEVPIIDSEAEATESEEEAPAADADKEQPFGTLEEALAAIGNLQVDLRTARAQADEAKNQALRLQADFQNFRRRQEKELGNTIRFANEDLMKQLLPILDNFTRTLDAVEKTDNLSAIKEGIAMVDKSMRRQLTKAGLEPIDSKGKPFDSELHEAITAIPAPSEEQKGMVIDEVEKGYKLKDRVLRYAKVVVGE